MQPPTTPMAKPKIVESAQAIEDRVQQAFAAIIMHEMQETPNSPSVAETARVYNVPVGRLRARLAGTPSKINSPSNNRKLTEDQELALRIYIDRLEEIGIHAREAMIRAAANGLLKRAFFADGNHDQGAQPPVVSDAWTGRFLERNPKYYKTKQKSMEVSRKEAAEDPAGIREWFAGFKRVCDEFGICAADIYNFDESGFRVGVGRNQEVIVSGIGPEPVSGNVTNRTSVTDTETISGDGEALPPFLILPGVIHQQRWYTNTQLLNGTTIAVSETGYTNDEISLEYIKHFERHSRRRQVGSWRLLLLDGHGSHHTREFIQFCDDHRIILYLLRPHTTHFLQPLDVVCFQPFKHYHAEAIDQATRTGCTDFSVIEFLDSLEHMRRQTFKRTTILSAWRKTGLIPFNPELVIQTLYQPEEEDDFNADPFAHCRTPTGSPAPESDPLAQPSSPTPTPFALPTTPTTIRSLKRQGSLILQRYEDASPISKKMLHCFLKGSLAQSAAGAQAFRDLAEGEAAQKARDSRRAASRRSLQKGGVLTVENARSMVQQHTRSELERAQQLVRNAEEAKLLRENRFVLAQNKKVATQIRKHFRTIAAASKRHLKAGKPWEPVPTVFDIFFPPDGSKVRPHGWFAPTGEPLRPDGPGWVLEEAPTSDELE